MTHNLSSKNTSQQTKIILFSLFISFQDFTNIEEAHIKRFEGEQSSEIEFPSEQFSLMMHYFNVQRSKTFNRTMINIEENKSIKDLNTFGMDVSTRYWLEFDDPSDIDEVMDTIKGNPWFCIGSGSNLLFKEDYPGYLIHSRITTHTTSDKGDDVIVTLGSGLEMDKIIEWAVNNGLWGIENLSGIPGQTGSAAVQNIGAYGVEIKDVIQKVVAYDIVKRQFVTFAREDCRYGYRTSLFKEPYNKGSYIVTSLTIKLSRKPKPRLEYGQLKSLAEDGKTPTLEQIRQEVLKIRAAKLPDPKEFGNAGSFFKNPVVSVEKFREIEDKVNKEVWRCSVSAKNNIDSENGNCRVEVPHYIIDDNRVKIPAAWMIEQCGFKGVVKDNAQVWPLQPLIIVNATGLATPNNIRSLAREIVDTVKARFDIKLEREVDYV